MKEIKNGFTLAEVLVTMAVLGVVAALTVPGMLANGKYQEVSTRFSKFVSTTENAARARAAAEGTIDMVDFQSILLYKKKDLASIPQADFTYTMRDGTLLSVAPFGGSGGPTERTLNAPFNSARYGGQLSLLIFEHKVTGIPNMQTTLDFILTDKGYIIPDPEDECATAIYNNNISGSWKLTSDMLDKSTGACYKPSSPPVQTPIPRPPLTPKPPKVIPIT